MYRKQVNAETIFDATVATAGGSPVVYPTGILKGNGDTGIPTAVTWPTGALKGDATVTDPTAITWPSGILKAANSVTLPVAAISGTDYSAGTSALATGILKSTTATGALSIAAAGDFPTLNQNTTGSAEKIPTGTPATQGAAGAVGQVVWDTAYLYVCTATSHWRRIALDNTAW